MDCPVTHMIWPTWSWKKMNIGYQVSRAPSLRRVGRSGARWRAERRREGRKKEAIVLPETHFARVGECTGCERDAQGERFRCRLRLAKTLGTASLRATGYAYLSSRYPIHRDHFSPSKPTRISIVKNHGPHSR